MSNNVEGGYFHKAQETYHQISTVCETKRDEIVEYLKPHLSQVNGAIVERVSKSVSDVLIGLCAVSGFLTIPAGLFFAVKKVLPLKAYIDEMRRDGSTKETVAAKWVEIKKEYKDEFTQKMGPILFVVLTVDAVFSIIIGALLLNPLLLLHGAAISAPAACFIYSTLKRDASSDQNIEMRPIVPLPQGGIREGEEELLVDSNTQ